MDKRIAKAGEVATASSSTVGSATSQQPFARQSVDGKHPAVLSRKTAPGCQLAAAVVARGSPLRNGVSTPASRRVRNDAKTNVYSLEGAKIREISVPNVFFEEIDKNLIKRAVLSAESGRLQPKGVKPGAGRNSTAEYVGSRLRPQMQRTINVEHARLPRKKDKRYLISGDVATVPQAVGGPRAHPPKVEKTLFERINKKEKRKAIRSAIAATGVRELAKARGHKFNESLSFPIVVDNGLENLDKTKKVAGFMEKLGIISDVERAKARKRIRAGKGKMRGRKYARAKSVLFVVNDNNKIYKAARNLEGVTIAKVTELNAKVLSPGAHPGRLTVWSEAAIDKLRGN